MISKDLLDILVCPETRQDLKEADLQTVEKLKKMMEEGKLKNRGGELAQGNINGALIREDNKYLYLVKEDIPVMLIDEAIPLEQLR